MAFENLNLYVTWQKALKTVKQDKKFKALTVQ